MYVHVIRLQNAVTHSLYLESTLDLTEVPSHPGMMQHASLSLHLTQSTFENQTNKETDRKRDRQTERQTDRETDIHDN